MYGLLDLTASGPDPAGLKTSFRFGTGTELSQRGALAEKEPLPAAESALLLCASGHLEPQGAS